MINRVQTVYDDRFFDSISDGASKSAKIVAPLVLELFNVKSVVDVGCGRGAWLKVFHELGVPTILGLDGSYVDRSALQIESKEFVATDLSEPFNVSGKFDLAICLEVAEHLPPRMARPLVQSLCQASQVVLFSAAIPGQLGTDHINEQWPAYWEALFAEMGFCKLDPIRPRIWRDRRIQSWYRQNLFVFVHANVVESSVVLTEIREESKTCDIELIEHYILASATKQLYVRDHLLGLYDAILLAVRRRWQQLTGRRS